jgi:hypothetical protein
MSEQRRPEVREEPSQTDQSPDVTDEEAEPQDGAESLMDPLGEGLDAAIEGPRREQRDV